MTVATKSRPIIMSAESVRAILDGRKTQTRRIVKPQPQESFCKHVTHGRHSYGWSWQRKSDAEHVDCPSDAMILRCPYGVPGDLLRVREGYRRPALDGFDFGKNGIKALIRYTTDDVKLWKTLSKDEYTRILNQHAGRHPGRHMPRWAARLWLRVVKVRVERVQEISEEDARAEGMKERLRPMSGLACAIVGVRTNDPKTYRETFRRTWDPLNEKRGHPWSNNDWVWVIGYKRTTQETT